LKNPTISNFTKVRPVRAKLFHADERTDGRTYNNSCFLLYCGKHVNI